MKHAFRAHQTRGAAADFNPSPLADAREKNTRQGANAQLERLLMEHLASFFRLAEERGIQAMVIGGYAVRAYAKATRHTRDVDLFIPADKRNFQKLAAALKELGFSYKIRESHDSRLVIAAKSAELSRHEVRKLEFHISFGEVSDFSCGRNFVPDFNRCQTRRLSAYYNENDELDVRVRVISPEELLVLKLMTNGVTLGDLRLGRRAGGKPDRLKDAYDVAELLWDTDADLQKVARLIKRSGLNEDGYMRGNIGSKALVIGGYLQKWLLDEGREAIPEEKIAYAVDSLERILEHLR